MTRAVQLKHRFVEYIPEVIEDAMLYISLEYGTVRHKCCCGCGEHVVTPLSPTDWKLTFDGETISLHPSIGNWSFDCKSHYWIRNGRVAWAPSWTQAEIDAGRRTDQRNKRAHYSNREASGLNTALVADARQTGTVAVPRVGWLSRLWQWFASLLRR
ncbi:MAG TPA: DUF6527 family protein [Polyangiaceae bacterium]